MLVDTDDTAIDKVEGPVQLPGGIGAGVEGGQDAVPDAGVLPAAEAAVDGLPGAVAFGVRGDDACVVLVVPMIMSLGGR